MDVKPIYGSSRHNAGPRLRNNAGGGYVSIYSEFDKPFSGTEFQQGQAAMIRSVEAFLTNSEKGLTDIAAMKDWLGRCFYAANMENFKSTH